jgi:hypothetical protein
MFTGEEQMTKTTENTGSRMEDKNETFKKKPYEKPVIIERSKMTFVKEILEELDGGNHELF